MPLTHQIARASIRENRKKYYLVFVGMNWPLFAIIIAGMVGGCILSIMVFRNYGICGAVGLSMGIAVSSIFLPFYFSNMEAIFEYLTIDISGSTEQYLQKVFGTNPESSNSGQENANGVKKDSDDTESK